MAATWPARSSAASSTPVDRAQSILVVEPGEATRRVLDGRFGVRTLAAADPSLARAEVVVWAVKPQIFAAAAAAVRGLSPERCT